MVRDDDLTAFEYYIREISGIEPLSMEEEQLLFMQGDKASLEKIFEAHLYLVINIAQKYQGMGLSLMDLIQEGNLGLYAAIMRFNVNRGNKLTTFAVPIIDQYIVNALREQAKTIRIPKDVYNKVKNYKKEFSKLTMELGREPSISEMAIALNIKYEEALRLNEYQKTILSLNMDIDDGTEFGEFVAVNYHNPETIVMEKAYLEQIRSSLLDSNLTKKEFDVIVRRFGFRGKRYTARAIADIYHVRRQAIEKTEHRAIEKLKKVKELYM